VRDLDHSRCWVCGSRDGVGADSRTFYYYTPGWVLIGLFFGWVPILFTYLIGRRKKRVQLSICGPCDTSWSRSKWLGLGVGGLGFIAFPFFLICLMSWTGWFGELGLLVGLLGGLLAWGLAALLASAYSERVGIRCLKIESDAVVLGFPRPDLTRSLVIEERARA
jgi:hypothetical protein